MRDLRWFYRRLKAMDGKEIAWRVEQKLIQKWERHCFYSKHLPVTRIKSGYSESVSGIDIERLFLNWENPYHKCFSELYLFGIFSYDKYKNDWDAGFQTEGKWPKDTFSYDISITQREDIGDIRTNWELNRHYQFAALSKSFYVSKDISYLKELRKLFIDWNDNNLFLHGVEWTSPMEIAIRINSWIFTYAFLSKAFEGRGLSREDIELIKELEAGIKLMTEHVSRHFSSYSSANNHRIIEAYAVALSGILFEHKKWMDTGLKILSEELVLQNYEDGVGKEMSLHYQCFVMEAYGLLISILKKNGMEVPEVWYRYLINMSRFVSDSCGSHGETIVFGDNDEGKLLNLSGEGFNYYHYILDLMGCVLPERYGDFGEVNENIHWFFTDREIEGFKKKRLYEKSFARCYEKGGYIFLRDKSDRVLIGIDCAELGFGKLAAHGHADALSFQMYVDGNHIFADAGTYNYHVPKSCRDVYRSTYSHNTVMVGDIEQSEMLGPFLWGSRAKNRIISFEVSADNSEAVLETEYKGIKHIRSFSFDYENKLVIRDTVLGDLDGQIVRQIFLLGPKLDILEDQGKICKISSADIGIRLETMGDGSLKRSEYHCSEAYNSEYEAIRLCNEAYMVHEAKLITEIVLEGQNG